MKPVLAFGFWVPPRFCRNLVLAALCFLALSGLGQRQPDLRPPPLDPMQAERQAREVVSEMLAQKPEQNATNTGVLRIRDRDRKEREVPVRIDTVTTPTNWFTVYETTGSGSTSVKLTVFHFPKGPNEYLLGQPAASEPKKFSGAQIMVSFAGSDFWVADLGLEFLHWPRQRLLRKEMRHSRFCEVLESIDPNPAPGGYSRVVSWIEIEQPHGVVHADAYDASNKRIKEFDPTKVEKIEGVYQLKSMQIRNLRSGSQTVIEFDLER